MSPTVSHRTEAEGRRRKIMIVGCAGVPAAYGGFETLAENLVVYSERSALPVELTVFCGEPLPLDRPDQFHGARLRYLPLKANGLSSIPYDLWSLAVAARERADAVLVLGVSGAIGLGLMRLLTRTRIVTNIDGIEWRRAKWGRLARTFLRWSEWAAVHWSHEVVADNEAVAEHVRSRYGVSCTVIAYGGDHAVAVPATPYPRPLPDGYALALCRIEPENNVEMILEAYARLPDRPLVFIGNWNASEFGRTVRSRYRHCANISLHDPEYDLGALRTLRAGACLYLHGHSAGGTNPSLVEMMHFGVPVLAFDCAFNRHTTHEAALFFQTAEDVVQQVRALTPQRAAAVGGQMAQIAVSDYTWTSIGGRYFRALM